MNYSVFGKNMKNMQKRVDVQLVTDEKKLLKLVAKPTFVCSKIFNENLVGVHNINKTLTLNRVAYVGMCILDLSETLMYDFYYNYIKQKYGGKAKLFFTDTFLLIVLHMKLKLNMFAKTFGIIKINLRIVIIMKTLHILILLAKKRKIRR